MKNIKYLLKHKYYVAIACFKYGLYWQGITHDLDKLFTNKTCEEHHGTAKHHWEYWSEGEVIPKYREYTHEDGYTFTVYVSPVPIPEKYLLEMLCDWWGAWKARDSKMTPKQWYNKNKDTMQLHPDSRKYLEDNINKFNKGKL